MVRDVAVRVENVVAAALPEGPCAVEHTLPTGEVLTCCLPAGHLRDPGKGWHYGWAKDGGQYAWQDKLNDEAPGQ